MQTDASPRLLGIDPGLNATGWGLIGKDSQSRLRHLASGTLRFKPSGTLAERLCRLSQALEDILNRFPPSEAAVETAYAGPGIQTSFKLAQARAVCLLAPARAGLPVAEYAPRTIKKAVTGTGKASKSQIHFMVKRLLPSASPDSEHAADALAIAICHAAMRLRNTPS